MNDAPVLEYHSGESIRSLDPDMDLKTMHTLYLDAGPGCFDRILALAMREYNSK